MRLRALRQLWPWQRAHELSKGCLCNRSRFDVAAGRQRVRKEWIWRQWPHVACCKTAKAVKGHGSLLNGKLLVRTCEKKSQWQEVLESDREKGADGEREREGGEDKRRQIE